MDFLILASVFIVGTIIGSFLNVVIYRYNSGTSPLKGRSHCFSCGKTLRWFELIPIASFLFSGGRCMACKVRLSWQYPVVEALTGAMFVLVFLLKEPIIETILLLLIFSTLIVIAVYDLRHQIIPDGLALLFAVLGLAKFFFAVEIGQAFHFPHAWTLIAGPMLFFPFWFLWFVSQGRWLGLGDGKLALGIGWFLGATLGGSAIMLAFWIGAAYALIIMAIQRIAIIMSAYASQRSKVKKSIKYPHFLSTFHFPLSTRSLSLKSEIPFGPFMIIAVLIVYFTKMNFFDGSITFFTF